MLTNLSAKDATKFTCENVGFQVESPKLSAQFRVKDEELISKVYVRDNLSCRDKVEVRTNSVVF